MTLDKRFALIANNGDVLYPYIKYQKATGRTGFALSTANNRDRGGDGDYTRDLAEVIRLVVFGGYAVRVKTEGKSAPEREGSVSLGKVAARKFYVAPEFEALTEGSEFERLDFLPSQRREHQLSEVQSLAASGVASAAEFDELRVGDFVEALLANEDGVTLNQRQMLMAHYAAPNRLLSMRQLAAAGGYESHATASFEYSKIGQIVADDLGIEGQVNWTKLLAVIAPSPATDGDIGWILREPLSLALEQLGWVESSFVTLEAQLALAELNKEVGFGDLPETTKQALVNARIGQGGFRRRMLQLWNGRCAVTGCAIGEVIVASHAKAWSCSSNAERLDEFNGLPLVATIDRLFDRGLIGFDDDGALLKGDDVDWSALAEIALTPSARLRAVHSRHIPYLQQHRARHNLRNCAF